MSPSRTTTKNATRWVVVLTALGSLMAALDTLVVSTALSTIRVDLGASATVSRVRLTWEAAYGKSYRVEFSPDGSSWTPAYSTTTGDGGVDDLSLSGTGRYVRMYGTARGTSYGYSLYEMEVYGSTGGTTPTPTPTV